MNTEKNTWTKFLKLYSEANAGRPTRLGVFEKRDGGTTDYWLEDGLPFVGIDCDRGETSRSVQVMVGAMTHRIQDAERVTFHLDVVELEEGIDVLDASSTLTVLRFEK